MMKGKMAKNKTLYDEGKDSKNKTLYDEGKDIRKDNSKG